MRNLIVMLFFVLPLAAQQAEVDRIFAAFNTHTPGCAVGVVRQGTVVLTSGYGMADLERNVPITAETVFESGSVAKQFTAGALLLLARQGKISLDDPLRKYLPELPDYGASLTVRHVISHISGLREWRPIAAFSGKAEGAYVLTNQDLLEMAGRQRALNFDPGTAYSYTNTGFNISTFLIERALGDGRTFQQFTHEAIFAPLGMVHSQWRDDFRKIVPGRALAYGPSREAGWVQQTPIENIIGAGGLLTTVGDLLRWNENFTHAKVGGPEFVQAQQTPATLANGRTISYSAGLMVATVDGLREVAHSGSTGGYRTWLGRYPDQGVSVAVLCNSAQADPTTLGRKTARLWTGGKEAVPAVYTPEPSSLESVTGLYRNLRDQSATEVRMKDGQLYFGPRPLTPVSAGRFRNGARELVFGNGRIRAITADGDLSYERVDPARPNAAELAALAGEYASQETASTVKIAVAGGKLTLAIGGGKPVVLTPTFQDAFSMPSGAAIYFRRDAAGKLTGLSAGEDRVWDLRFLRVR